MFKFEYTQNKVIFDWKFRKFPWKKYHKNIVYQNYCVKIYHSTNITFFTTHRVSWLFNCFSWMPCKAYFHIFFYIFLVNNFFTTFSNMRKERGNENRTRSRGRKKEMPKTVFFWLMRRQIVVNGAFRCFGIYVYIFLWCASYCYLYLNMKGKRCT